MQSKNTLVLAFPSSVRSRDLSSFLSGPTVLHTFGLVAPLRRFQCALMVFVSLNILEKYVDFAFPRSEVTSFLIHL